MEKTKFTWFQKLIASFWIFGLLFTFSGMATANTMNVRDLKAELGLLQRPGVVIDGIKYYSTMLSRSVFGSVEVNAQLGVFVVGSFEQLIRSAIQSLISSIISQFVDQMFKIFDDIIGFLDSWAEIFKGLANFVSGYRAAMAFEAFASIQAREENTETFLERMFDRGDELSPDLAFEIRNSDFLIAMDAVAWLDFMTILRYLNVGIISDFVRDIIGFEQDEYDDLYNSLVNLSIGSRCNDYLYTGLPLFGEFYGANDGCTTENGSEIFAMLEERQKLMEREAQAVLDQKTREEPDNCEGLGYVAERNPNSGELTGRVGFEVDTSLSYSVSSDRGALSSKIQQLGRRIKAQPLTQEECAYLDAQWEFELAAIESSDQPNTASVDIGTFIVETVAAKINEALSKIYERITESVNVIIAAITTLQNANLEILLTVFNISTFYRTDITNALDTAVDELRERQVINNLDEDDVINE